MNEPDDTPEIRLFTGIGPEAAERYEIGHSRESDAIEATHLAQERQSILAVKRDPSLATTKSPGTGSQHRNVTWVRPTELIARSGATASGRGIDFQKDLARRFRSGTAEGTRRTGTAIRDRASRLPDLSMHGRHYPAPELVSERTEMGLR